MATAAITISSTVTGLPEGSTVHDSISQTNSSAVGWTIGATASTHPPSTMSTVFTGGSVFVPTSGKYMLVVPTATNTHTLRVGFSTNVTTVQMLGGMLLAATGASLFSVVGNSTYYFYTTATTAVPLRITVY